MVNFKTVSELRGNVLKEDKGDFGKIQSLARSGFLDMSKLSLALRALKEDNFKMSKAERNVLLELVNTLSEAVQEDSKEYILTEDQFGLIPENQLLEASQDIIYAKTNVPPNGNKGKKDIDINSIPPIVILKRKAIRVFPDGQKVALYWADRINKYVSIPFSSVGLSEEKEPPVEKTTLQERFSSKISEKRLDENWLKPLALGAGALRGVLPAGSWAADVAGAMAGRAVTMLPQGAAAAGRTAATAGQAGIRAAGSLARGAGKLASRVPNVNRGPWGPKVPGKLPKVTGNSNKLPSVPANARGAANKLPGGPSALSRVADAMAGNNYRSPQIDPDDIKYYKEKPKSGISNVRGIDPFLSGESPASSGYYETEVGRRQLYKAASGAASPYSAIREDTLTQLKTFLKSEDQTKTITINEEHISINRNMASSVVRVYENVNKENKTKINKLLNEDLSSFLKVLDFSVKNSDD